MSNPGHFETGEHIKGCRKFQPGNIDPRTNHRKRNILRQKIKKKSQSMVLFENLVLNRAEKKKKTKNHCHHRSGIQAKKCLQVSCLIWWIIVLKYYIIFRVLFEKTADLKSHTNLKANVANTLHFTVLLLKLSLSFF